MVTLYKMENKSRRGDDGYAVVELRGLSSDEKPTVLPGKYFDDNQIETSKYVDNGSIFIEIDTGNIFCDDLENEEWKEA